MPEGETVPVTDAKAAAYRLGIITVLILAALTVVELVIAITLGSIVLLFIVALIKAVIIIQNFMHISRLWRGEEH